MSGASFRWLALAVLGVGCTPLLDLDGYDYVETQTGTTGGAGGDLPTGGSSGGDGGMGASSSGGVGGDGGSSGGAGGASPCGNGVIDAGEECDDDGTSNGDGCSDSCIVECSGSGYTKELTTFHCYYFETTDMTWDDARTACQAHGAGWELSAFNSIAERNWGDAVNVNGINTFVWIGATDAVTEGDYEWSNGETWSSEATALLMNITGDPEDCIFLNPVFGDNNDDFGDLPCDEAHHSLCELTPAGS